MKMIIMKKSFFHTSVAVIFGWLVAGVVQAANFNLATPSTPAQISIENALITTASGNKHASIRLVAKDNEALREGQIYQAHFGPTNVANYQDAQYDEGEETIYIQKLLQAGSLSHQTTLKRTNLHPLEFTIIEITTSVVQPANNIYFDPSSAHKVNYQLPEN